MKTGRTNLKCNGVLPEPSLWNRPIGEDPELDYLRQFLKWPGFDAWLKSLKNKLLKQSKVKSCDDKKILYIEDDDDIQDCIEWLLEFLPDATPQPKEDKPVNRFISLEEFEKLENTLLCLLSDNRSPGDDFADCTSQSSVVSISTRNRSENQSRRLTGGSTSSKRSKRGSAAKMEIETNLESSKKVSIRTKEKKGKRSKKEKSEAVPSSKKLKQKEEPETEQDPTPQSQMPELLKLFDEFDAIQRDKEEFYKSIQDFRYPENPSIAAAPANLIIMGFHQYQVYKLTFSIINSSEKPVQLIFDKVISPQHFLFKVRGPRVARVASGGYQHYQLEFCCDVPEDIIGDIKYIIRNSEQTITQKYLPIFCYSCCTESFHLETEYSDSVIEQSSSLSIYSNEVSNYQY